MSSEDCGSRNDRCLQNWEKWLEERRKVAKKVGRPPGEMVMNIGEEIKGIREDQLVLQYTKIPTHFDKLRGNPAFWKFPYRLKDKSPCGDGPDLWAVWTKEQQNVIPEIDYVGVPEYIKGEKNIIPRTRDLYSLWQKSDYRQRKVRALTAKIQRVQPHKPRIEDLIIIGHGAKKQDEALQETNEAPEGSELGLFFNNDDIPEPQQLDASKAMLINDVRFDNSMKHLGATKFRMSFSQDISVRNVKPSRKHLVLQNLSNVVVKISWKKKEKFRLLREYVDDEKFDKHGFFFNKSELWLMPNEPVEFPVWFFSDHPGVYSETWELETEPAMWHGNFHVYLVLDGDTYSQQLQDKVAGIMEMIEEKAKDAIIKEILDSLTLKIRYDENPKRPCEIDVRHEFEFKNMVGDRIRYLYSKVIVEKQLKEFFDKVNANEIEEQWNYSLKMLRVLAKIKDFSDYFTAKQTKLMEWKALVDAETQKRRAEETKKGDKQGGKDKKGDKKGGKDKKGDKSSKKGSNKSKSSKDDKKGKKGKKKDKPEAEPVEVKIIRQWNEDYIFTWRREYESLVTQLETVTIRNCQREKLFEASKVFTLYFSKMCTLLDRNHRALNVRRICSYPQNVDARIRDWEEEPERKVYEYFEQHHMPKPTHTEDEPQIGFPKPKSLKKISAEEPEAVFTTYFQKPIVPLKKRPVIEAGDDAKKKGKKGNKKDKKSSKGSSKGNKKDKKDKKGKKGGKGDKKGKQEKEVKPVESEEIVFFDPYSEEFKPNVNLDNISRIGSIREGAFDIPLDSVEEHHLNSYVIIYECLGEAVDALVDALTPFECEQCTGTF